MKKAIVISRQTIDAALKYLRDGVDINELDLPQDLCNRIRRVKYAIELKENNLNAFAFFKKLAAGRYNSASEEWRVAKKDEALYNRLMSEVRSKREDV